MSNKLTSLAKNPLAKSLTISHGIGSFIDTRTALFTPNHLVLATSRPPCTAIPRATFAIPHSAILTSRARILARLLVPPGSPASPCALTTTAAEGVRMSNRKKASEGPR